jgi:hypothetical protein
MLYVKSPKTPIFIVKTPIFLSKNSYIDLSLNGFGISDADILSFAPLNPKNSAENCGSMAFHFVENRSASVFFEKKGTYFVCFKHARSGESGGDWTEYRGITIKIE